MLRKILITILVILLLLVAGLFTWAFLISKESGGEVGVIDSVRDIISFDAGNSDVFGRLVDNFVGTSDTGLLDTGTVNGQSDSDVSLLRLRKITTFPVTRVFVSKNDKNGIFAKFISRENGHVFEISADSTTQKRLSNTTILRIWDTLWLQGGESFIARFLDEDNSEIKSFYAEIKTQDSNDKNGTDEQKADTRDAGSEGSLEGTFLQNNIKEIALAEGKNKIFYLIPSGKGSIGIISDPDGNKRIQVFDSPLSQWQAQWPEGKKIALTTKPSANIPGYMYFLDTDTKKLNKIISGLRGLTTLVNKAGTKVLYTHNEGDRLLLSILNIKSGEVTDLPIWTLAEKCIWSDTDDNIVYCGVPNIAPKGDDLDLWYQGLISFSDNIWMIDTKTQTANILINLSDVANEDIDLIKPVLSPNENYMFFVNKKDSNLWQFRLLNTEN